jgi:mannose-6-phosphate isomerase-like protein (cupin superfamily)
MSDASDGRAKLGYGLGKDEGEAFWVLGMLETIKISSADTDGRYGLVEVVARAGDGPPWHVHHEEDEWFYALEGTWTVYVGDEQVDLTPGSFAFGPKGVPHTFVAETEGAKVLVGLAPVMFEGFIREAGTPAPERVLPPRPDGPPDMAVFLPMAARHGFDILGPPGHPPSDSH